ncbi:histidine kinase dimerization/phosphoacceptor domain -containing protein [Zobellia galactanivorans]|uniref:sensor histidine kinase n=1 Tax=Zobellia galactanivorans (strain DSM 12802 / CCUG 47099 / CIP 106680 / NCIMB 13871 / Dsij) TaxID=63186 RepID=UPI0026E4839B|nr:histidine kinase dimerization/phosphoacceptor domain -containing protein [Zobellia galactanivorans]MDO6810560.1 histidine kinase dimerization/phosphoacceptor domain -containing protein [Zobellia galactanivorans]
MRKPKKSLNRISDKTTLLLKFNYVSSFLSLAIGLICIYAFDMHGTIPYVFFFYSASNLLNVLAFRKHKNLMAMAIYTSIISFLGTVVITLYSGGINSPFIFVLGLVVLAGYISTRWFGTIYLYLIISTIVSIYLIDYVDFDFIENEVPENVRDLFSLISVLFSVYLLGGVFGKNLLSTHHRLYRSKARIEKSIDEKENLLREVHHRVKNNLQTVSSLLSLQARNTPNEQIKALVRSSQNRVTSMAMIHEMLYVRDNLSKIEFGSYVNELSQYLLRTVERNDQKIKVNLDIPETLLSIDTAIPLGLLINETVTNSIKYGFKDRNEGEITIELEKRDQDCYILKISDDGSGFALDHDYKNYNTLGLRLIHNLARQLQGSIDRIPSKKGTKYKLVFQDITDQFNP